MTRFILSLFAFVALAAGPLLAQDITGTWQGTLQPPGGKVLRIVIKVSKADGGGLRGVLYSIDQSGQGIAVNSVTLQGAAVKMSIPGVGGSYEGKLDSDGVTITGTFQQGAPLPLNLKRASEQTAWAIPEAPAPMKPMADAAPEFEVATLKPSRPETQGRGITVRGRQLITINTTLSDLIAFVYGIHPKQLVGAPSWVESDHYDLTAKPAGEGQPSLTQFKTMLEKLLADRFQLTFHRDKKELSVYAIMIGKNGPKLGESAGNSAGLPGLFFRALGNLTATNSTMADFAGLMQSTVLDRPVVDQTGLTKRWDFTLNWKPDEFQFASLGGGAGAPLPANAESLPDLYTAVRDQLGLKLEPTKAPADVLVIDRVAKPSEN